MHVGVRSIRLRSRLIEYILLTLAEVLKLAMNEHEINEQSTLLHATSARGHNEIVKILTSYGVDERISNDRGKTPAQEAEEERYCG